MIVDIFSLSYPNNNFLILRASQRYKLFLCFTILCQKKWRGGVEIGNKNKLSFNLFMDEIDEMSANNIREIYSL